MGSAQDSGDLAGLEDRFAYLAWRWYGLSSDVADELRQTAHATYLEVRDRYPNPEEHPRILVGIFRNKCREYIDGQVRETRLLRDVRRAAASGEASTHVIALDEADGEGLLQELLSAEKGRLIFAALAGIRPEAREMFQLIVEKGYSRQQLIEHYGLNPNTFDSRLRTYRKELKAELDRRGVET